ncbi:porin [Roseomonas sp. AR75]|uniref:porin n=1 Tax=Roseomonas sp. AR75 TaxID=2562311 RepID=UPI0010C02503|nr:porin [Roseomonas sp. AR75]
MRQAAIAAVLAAGCLACAATPALAQGSDADTIAELRRQLEAMQRRLEALEARQTQAAPVPLRAAAPTTTPTPRPAPAARSAAAPRPARSARPVEPAASTATVPATPAPSPEAVQEAARQAGREAAIEALRSDLPGIAFRVPGTETQVRLYGFVKLTSWRDFDSRNQTDAPAPALTPLQGSVAALQGGDYGMTARFSRFGVDTRSETGWGRVETRLEGDFGGGPPTSNNAVFRLRQAFAELTFPDGDWRVLIGQANSLWNEGLYETIIDATNLNQSFIRQAQLRLTRVWSDPGSGRTITGQVALEAPDTNYVAVNGLVTPTQNSDGSASPAINTAPDLHARLTWRQDGWEGVLRGMLRQLSINTSGTTAPAPQGEQDTLGWGVAGHVRMPMRVIGGWFGPDELVGGAFVGQGIGRYLFGNSGGSDAITNLGLPAAATGFDMEAIPTWGLTAAYRRFWTTQLRSNFVYSWAKLDYPDYAAQFTPGSAAATSLNDQLQQVFANLIWSPFSTLRADGTVDTGWLDLGIEYLYTRRDLYGGAAAAMGAGGIGHGIQNRVLVGAIARF